MGLDTSHDCWHGSYSSFAWWRGEVAVTAGWNKDYNQYPSRAFKGWWDEPPEDPLDVLMVHSDCDGYIFPEHAGPLADRLEKLPLTDAASDLRDMFVEGLRSAADNEEIVIFH